MEKISRILPPSARTKSYDISRAQPGRPGAPQAGRPSYEPTIDKMILSDALTQSLQDQFAHQDSKVTIDPGYSKPKESVKSEMIKKMTDQFFMRKNDPTEVAKDGSQTISEEVAERVNRSSDSNVMPESSKELTR